MPHRQRSIMRRRLWFTMSLRRFVITINRVLTYITTANRAIIMATIINGVVTAITTVIMTVTIAITTVIMVIVSSKISRMAV
jgi:hypothetical protein